MGTKRRKTSEKAGGGSKKVTFGNRTDYSELFDGDPTYPWSVLRARLQSPFRAARLQTRNLKRFVDEVPDIRSSELAKKVEGAVLQAVALHLNSQFDSKKASWLLPYLVDVCAEYLTLAGVLNLPTSKELRQEVENLRHATATLIFLLRNARSSLLRSVTELTYVRAGIVVRDIPDLVIDGEIDWAQIEADAYADLKGVEDGVDLLNRIEEIPVSEVRTSIVDLLELIENALPDPESIVGPPGDRPRWDHFYLAAAGADIWSHISGRPFPRHAAGENGTFDGEHASFVMAFLQCFDSNATFSNAKSALKRMLEMTVDK